jgi:hypothetical protein
MSKGKEKKNYHYECIACGYNFDDDNIIEDPECTECGEGKFMHVYQQVFLKCPICKKDIKPDENDSDGAYISGGVVTIHEILYGYYTGVNSIDVDDWDTTLDYYHKKCLEKILSIEKEPLKKQELNEQLEEDIVEILSIVDRYSLWRKCVWQELDNQDLTNLYNHFITALTLKCKPKHKERVERILKRKIFEKEKEKNE